MADENNTEFDDLAEEDEEENEEEEEGGPAYERKVSMTISVVIMALIMLSVFFEQMKDVLEDAAGEELAFVTQKLFAEMTVLGFVGLVVRRHCQRSRRVRAIRPRRRCHSPLPSGAVPHYPLDGGSRFSHVRE